MSDLIAVRYAFEDLLAKVSERTYKILEIALFLRGAFPQQVQITKGGRTQQVRAHLS